MKRNLKHIVVFGFILGMCLTGTVSIADAGSQAAVEKQIQVMREQMEMMQKKMQDLEQDLQTAQQSAQKSAVQAQQAADTAQQQVNEVAGKFKMLDDLQAKFGHIKLNGYVRSRWWKADHANNSFDVTEIALQMRYDVSENISGEFHLWFHPSGNGVGSEYANWAGPTTFMESGFAEFRNLNIGPINGKLIAGKTRNLAFGITPGGNYNGRVTSDYSLFHQSVNISRITGIQYLTNYKNFKWNFALFNGWGYGKGKPYGVKGAAVKYLGVGQQNTDDNSDKAFTTRFAYAFDRNDLFDKLEIGVSYLKQNISTDSRDNIYTLMGRNLTTNKTSDDYSKKDEKYGFDIAMDSGPWMLKAEYLHGDTSEVEADYAYIMGGYKLSKVSNIPLDFFLRYSFADYDESRTTDISGSGAWDKSQWTPLVVWHLHPKAKLYFEYYFNKVDEPTGASSPSNDYAFVELILFY